MKVDLAIVGGGPAGLAAAIHGARAGMKVAVVEALSGPIDKACGEGIMPGGVLALERLNVQPRGRRFIGVRYSDAVARGRTALGTFRHGNGLAVRRTELHGTLLGAARAAGVTIREGRVAEVALSEESTRVLDIRADWLIGADGLRSRVREAIGVRLPARFPPRLGLRRHYLARAWSDRVEVYFAAGAEAYVTPVEEGLIDVAILFTGVGHDFASLLERFPLLAARLPRRAATRPRGAGPFEQRVSRPAAGRVLLIGDAAGYLDPLTGEGIALGLLTAEAAIRAITQSGDVTSAYVRAYRKLTRRYFALTSTLLHVAHRRALHRPLLAAAGAFPQLFDRLLDPLSGNDAGDIHESGVCSSLPQPLAEALADHEGGKVRVG